MSVSETGELNKLHSSLWRCLGCVRAWPKVRVCLGLRAPQELIVMLSDV